MPSQDLLAGEPSATRRRVAWLAVIIMTALFVLALGAVIWGFVRQARIVMAARPAAAASAPGGPAAVLTLAPGVRIVSASTEAGKLVLHLATAGGGGEVQIIDLATGKLTARIVTETVPGK